MLTFIGCGVEDGDISRKAWETMLECDHLILQTEKMEIFLKNTKNLEKKYAKMKHFKILFNMFSFLIIPKY